MDKPTCESCVYWDWKTHWKTKEGAETGDCRRKAPGSRGSFLLPKDGFCGEHPNFPLYLKSLRSANHE